MIEIPPTEMSIVVNHVRGSMYSISFHNKQGASQLFKGPKYHTKLHYEMNDNLRSWVLRYGLQNVVYTGILECWLRELISAAVFTTQPATTPESVCLIRLESYPLLLGLFT